MSVGVEFERPPPCGTTVPSKVEILLEEMASAYIAQLSKKKAEAYLTDVDRRMQIRAAEAETIPIRPTPNSKALACNRLAAAKLWETFRPVLRASVRRR